MATSRRKRHQSESDGPSLNREVIIAAAIDLIDEAGLDAFSLRGLASRLGVYPTAIYWYVSSRNEIMGQVVSEVLRDALPKQKRRDWRVYLRELFANFRGAVRAHPNVAPLIGTQLVSNADISPAFIDQILEVLGRAGLEEKALVAGYNGVLAALIGFIVQEFATVPRDDPAVWQASVQQKLLNIDLARYPSLSRSMPLLLNRAFILRWQNGIEAPLDESFEMFVEIMIGGIEALARGGAMKDKE